MKLNSECIRGLLLSIEEICDFDTLWEYQQDDFESEFLAEYTHDEILYHIRQAERAKLIEDVHYYNGGSHVTIRDLTPKAMNFWPIFEMIPYGRKLFRRLLMLLYRFFLSWPRTLR